MKTSNDIVRAVLAGDFTAEEIRIMSNAVSVKFKEMQRRSALAFRRGDKVSFTARNGETITGVVAKINQKTVTINTTNSQWKVSGSLLKKA